MTLDAEDIAAAIARIETKLDGHIEHSREWRAHTDGAIADLGAKVQRLDQLRHGGAGMLLGLALAAGAAGSFAVQRLKSLLGS